MMSNVETGTKVDTEALINASGETDRIRFRFEMWTKAVFSSVYQFYAWHRLQTNEHSYFKFGNLISDFAIINSAIINHSNSVFRLPECLVYIFVK